MLERVVDSLTLMNAIGYWQLFIFPSHRVQNSSRLSYNVVSHSITTKGLGVVRERVCIDQSLVLCHLVLLNLSVCGGYHGHFPLYIFACRANGSFTSTCGAIGHQSMCFSFLLVISVPHLASL